MRNLLAILLMFLPLAASAQSYRTQSPPLPGYPVFNGATLSAQVTFPGPSTYPLPSGLSNYGWLWGSRTDLSYPDPSLPSTVKQTYYVTCCRFEWLLDEDKTSIWFHENHPDWIAYGTPLWLQGTMTAGGTALTNITYDTSHTASDYTVYHTSGFPTGTVVSSISADGTTITMSQPSHCATDPIPDCGAQTSYTIGVAGEVAQININGTTTDGSADITNVSLRYNGIFAPNGVAGVQGTFIMGNSSCVAAGTTVATITDNQTYAVDTPFLGGCPGGTQTFTALPDSQQSIFSPYGVCNDNCKYTPLNIADPDVKQFLTYGCTTSGGDDCTILLPIKNGFWGIALDNDGGACGTSCYGHYAGAAAPCVKTSQPACGGTFIQQYAGNLGWGTTVINDQDYTLDHVKWTQYLKRAINGVGGALIPNVNTSISQSPASVRTLAAGIAEMANSADGFLIEHAGSKGCDGSGHWVPFADNLWINNFNLAQATRIPMTSLEFSTCFTTISSPQGAEEEYNVATWLLMARVGCVNGQPTQPCFWFTTAGTADRAQLDIGNVPSYDSSWTPVCGSLASAGKAGIGTITSTDTAYERLYPNCIVGLNPSSTSTATLTLPAGHTYTDLFGNPVAAGVVTLNASAPNATGNSLVAIIQ